MNTESWLRWKQMKEVLFPDPKCKKCGSVISPVMKCTEFPCPQRKPINDWSE